MSEKWRKVLVDVIKYSVSAVLGAFGFSFVSGCAAFPVLNF